MAKSKGIPKAGDPRLAAWLANPGLRSKLPDSLLTPAQRKQRAINSDPYHKPIEQMVGAKFGETERALDRQLVDTGTQDQRIGSWFGQYQQALKDARDRQAVVQGQAQQGAANLATAMGALSGQMNAGNDQQMVQSAAQRGATVDPSVGRVAQDASGVRGALNQLSANTLATQGASNDALMQAAIAAASGMQTSALRDNQDVRSAILGDRKQLAADKGAFRVDARGQLEDAAFKRELEAKAFGLDEISKINPKTGLPYEINPATGRPYAKPLSESEKNTKARREFFEKHGYYPPTGDPAKKGKGKKPKSGLGSRTAASEAYITSAIGEATKAIKGGAKRRDLAARNAFPTAPDGKSMRTFTPRESRVIANAANDMAKLGYLSPANVRALRAIGVHVKGFPRSRKQGIGTGTDPLEDVRRVGEAVETIGRTISGGKP